MFPCTHLSFALLSLPRTVAARFRSRSCILLSPISQSRYSSPSSPRTSQFRFKKANTALQSRPFSSTALIIKWSSNLLYFLCGALRFLSALPFRVDLEVSVLEEVVEEVLVLGLAGISISPPNAALKNILSFQSIVVSAKNHKVWAYI